MTVEDAANALSEGLGRRLFPLATAGIASELVGVVVDVPDVLAEVCAIRTS